MTRMLSEAEKKELAIKVGHDLVATHGTKKYYSRKQVTNSLEKYQYSPDIFCWAYCLYMDHASFDSYHASINETCDYLAMKESMAASVTDHASDSWFDFDFDLSWLEFPDIDLSDIFDFLDF